MSSEATDRQVHDGIVNALNLSAKERKKELEGVLNNWQGAGDPTTVSEPHMLVYFFKQQHPLASLPGALKGKDRTHFNTIKETCEELGFKVYLTSVGKKMAAEVWVDPYEARRWQKSRPAIDPREQYLDELLLEKVMSLDGEDVAGRLPIKDSETVQEQPFAGHRAQIDV
ncbi:hypothetical protein BDV96DRAFT_598805 [Lophiotrema nucula]|uniref:Uncharacterized protein n=1 Tax=Lophiotrema nucula TaxID=690887 RepID=A0A6A5Z9B3_9PLEO|nr:hypothetical protein BDV96DRAFT_598805 [Lophiotrema nucula]